MANIFLKLSPTFKFTQQVVQRITGAKVNESVQEIIEEFYEQEHSQKKQYFDFVLTLLSKVTTKQAKQKLLVVIVYMLSDKFVDSIQENLQKILNLNSLETISKIKFFSHVYKSFDDVELRRWTIYNSIVLLEKQQKISCFSSFIEHIDELILPLNFPEKTLIQIYIKIINYLEKHPVYNKLRLAYVVKCLKIVKEEQSKTPEITKLIVLMIKNGIVSQELLSLLDQKYLKNNELYPLLQIFLSGQFENTQYEQIQKFERFGFVANQIIKKMKIQAIPRLFSSAKFFSYDQFAQILKIKKEEVQLYIIQAIKEGLVVAKLDQFGEGITFKKINFRVLRKGDQAKLQNQISRAVNRLQELHLK